MKKLISLLVVLTLVTLCAATVFAEPQYAVVSETTQQLADGASVTITVSKEVQPFGARAVTEYNGKKEYTYRSGGSVAWVFAVYGSFDVNKGISSTCKNAYYSFNASQSGWNIAAASAYPSGNTAKASATVVGPNTVYPSVSISCDINGNLY